MLRPAMEMDNYHRLDRGYGVVAFEKALDHDIKAIIVKYDYKGYGSENGLVRYAPLKVEYEE